MNRMSIVLKVFGHKSKCWTQPNDFEFILRGPRMAVPDIMTIQPNMTNSFLRY